MRRFTPLEKIYWLRLGLGLMAALACAGYGWITGAITLELGRITYTTLLNSISIALAIYLVSYYAIKMKFINQVAKPTKLVTTGIGIYFLGWIVFWALLYTIIGKVMPV